MMILCGFINPLFSEFIFFSLVLAFATGDGFKKACDVPQQNQYSHYKCDENGDLKCLPGKHSF